MRHPLLLTVLVALVVGALASTAGAEPGRTTLQETIHFAGDSRVKRFTLGPGEPHLRRTGGGAVASAHRATRRQSLAFFAHLSDPQVADPMSPARLEFLRPAGGWFLGAWRPQEALTLHAVDQTVRNLNRNTVSPVPAANGRRARLGFALVTGDLADNAQVNEVSWAVRAIEGGPLDPFSGQRISRRNPCRGAPAAVRRRLNAAVAQRLYTGVQDHRDWPGRPRARYREYWDPNSRAAGGPYAAYPTYPGLLKRALQPFRAEGLSVRWYSARGNHDAHPTGFIGPRRARRGRIATGCRKVFPSRRHNPRRFKGDAWRSLRFRLRRRDARWVPPDRRRRFVSGPAEFKRLHGRADRRHGFALTPRTELRRSRGAAAYYSFSPRRGLRFVSLDTTADAGGPNGNLDHPQYRWLSRTLRRSARRRELVVMFAHHSLRTMVNRLSDERAGRFDRDPRRSRPIHLGSRGRASLRSLLLRHRHVVLYVGGHEHRNSVRPVFRRNGRGFWQITTAALVGTPQQARVIELMDNHDGTLSIFGTLVNSAAATAVPRSGTPAAGLRPDQLGSIARLAAYHPLATARHSRAALSARGARNVELLLRDPRRGPARRGSARP